MSLEKQKVKVCRHHIYVGASNWKFWDKYCQSCCIARRPPFVCTNWIGSEAIAQILYNASWKIETYFLFLHKIYFRASLHRSLITPHATLEPAFPVLRLPSSSPRPRSSYKRKRNHDYQHHDYEHFFCHWGWCCLQIREVVLGLQLNSRILWDFAQKGKL